MTLALDDKERDVLKLVLESFEAELKGEIGKTDDRGYRSSLRGEEGVIKKLLEKVSLRK